MCLYKHQRPAVWRTAVYSACSSRQQCCRRTCHLLPSTFQSCHSHLHNRLHISSCISCCGCAGSAPKCFAAPENSLISDSFAVSGWTCAGGAPFATGATCTRGCGPNSGSGYIATCIAGSWTASGGVCECATGLSCHQPLCIYNARSSCCKRTGHQLPRTSQACHSTLPASRRREAAECSGHSMHATCLPLLTTYMASVRGLQAAG